MTINRIKKVEKDEYGSEIDYELMDKIYKQVMSELGPLVAKPWAVIERTILILDNLGYLEVDNNSEENEDLPVWRVSSLEMPIGIHYIAMDWSCKTDYNWWGYIVRPKMDLEKRRFVCDYSSQFMYLSKGSNKLPSVPVENWDKSLHRVVFVD